MNEYKKVRREFLLNPRNRFCKARIPGICLGTRVQGIELDIHHTRGRLGDLLCDTRYFLPVCRACHEYLESHVEIAKTLGFSQNRLTTDE